MNMMAKSGILAGILLLAACSGLSKGERPPDWVSGDAGEWPAASWLLGRGNAGTLDEASNRARAELARIFEVEVQVESSDQQVFERRSGGVDGQASEYTSLIITRSIDTHSRKIIRGASIGGTWQDPQTGNWHALATLSRQASAQSLRQEISALDEATRIEVQRARNSDDLLSSIAAARDAVDHQIERAAVQRMLQVVDLTGQGTPARWELARLRADLDSMMARMTIRPEARGNESLVLSQALASGISQAGFTVDTTDGNYQLIADLDLEDLGRIEGWFWHRGMLEIVLIDPEGHARGARRWEVKASARDPGTSSRRALDEAASILQRELRSTLLQFTGKD